MIKTVFGESLEANMHTEFDILNELLNIAISSIYWNGLPSEIDMAFMEYSLIAKGNVVFFHDSIINKYIALPAAIGGTLSIYNVGNSRNVQSASGYHRELDNTDSVVVYNCYTRTPIISTLYSYARRIWEIARTFDINIFSQKTPVLLLCPENQKLTLENVYKEYAGNAPVIKGYKGIDRESFTVLNTGSPFISDKLIEILGSIWSEALTFLGVVNSVQVKKERQNVDETNVMMGRVYANRNARMFMREQAAKEINNMFGLNVRPVFRDPFKLFSEESKESGDVYE